MHVQTDVVVPSDLTLSIEATSRLGPLVSSEEMVLTVMMYNPTSSISEIVTLNQPNKPPPGSVVLVKLVVILRRSTYESLCKNGFCLLSDSCRVLACTGSY